MKQSRRNKTTLMLNRISLGAIKTLLLASAAIAHTGDPITTLKQQYSSELQQRAKRLSITPRADQRLLDHTQQFIEPKLVSLGKSVQVAIGYDYSVYAFIETKEGVIAIDTGWFMPNTERALKDYRDTVKKPIKAIVYTHTHGDHVGGTAALIPPEQRDNIQIIGPRDWQRNVQYEVESGGKVYRRAFSQFGAMLPQGIEGAVSTGLAGPLQIGQSSTAYNVTREIRDDVEELEVAGTKLVFVNAGGDIPENLMVYAPDSKTLFVGDILDGCLVPMATARWEPERQARTYQHSLEIALQRFPEAEHLVSGHGRTTSGVKAVQQRLQNARDIVKYTADVVERSVTLGLSPDQIIEQIKFPIHLAEDPDLQPYYHRLDWIIRGMYTKLGGWTTDINSLTRLTDTEEAKRLIAQLGGSDAVLAMAAKAISDQDYRWAITLATFVLRVEPDKAAAKEMRKDALLGVAYSTRSANERNYALTEIVQPPWPQVLSPFLETGLKNLSIEEILSQWPLLFDLNQATKDRFEVQLTVTGETREQYFLSFNRGLIDLHPGRSDRADLHISMDRDTLERLTTGQLKLPDANDKIRVKGNNLVYQRLKSLFTGL